MSRAALISLLSFMVLLAPLAGCAKKKTASEEMNLDVCTDTATGCQYLAFHWADKAITPRIAADGKTHMGCKGATQ